ncbi:hypothetical protein TNCV_3183111 [Trichonephila clavipes]|uniref:Uncharacterized protein n=1 Tax=Trichonephila clavipes TaxID=2585209 RepID=A0A8X6SHC5_TRICX|nr:hypothetical protein TNCV_3183111 [Trichonephila clavipes]
MTLNTFTSNIEKESDHCDVSRFNEFLPTCRLKGRINVDDSSPRDSTGLGSCVDFMSCDVAGLGSEQNVKRLWNLSGHYNKRVTGIVDSYDRPNASEDLSCKGADARFLSRRSEPSRLRSVEARKARCLLRCSTLQISKRCRKKRL